MIKVIKSLEEFKALESTWGDLYERSQSKTPFQCFSYVFLAWTLFESKEGDLYIIVSISNNSNDTDGIFPCYIDRKHTLRFINDRHTDFCNAIIDKESFGYSSYEELSGFLKRDSNIRLIHFANLEYDNQLKSSFKPFFNSLFVFENNAYSRLMISPQSTDKDFVDSIRGLSAKGRKNIRAKLASEHELQFELLSLSKGKDYPRDEVLELRHLMISKGERTQEYFNEKMLSFWHRLYQEGLIVVSLLYKKNLICSVNLMFFDRIKNEYIKWIMLYREKKYNLIANIKLIEYLYNKGGSTLNFARGIYDYKMVSFHPIVFNLYSLYLSKAPVQSVKVLLLLNWHYIKMILKSIIRK